MAVIDIAILAILVIFLIKGMLRGLLKEVCSLLGLVLGGVFAFTFHLPLGQFLQDSFDLPAQLCIWGSFLAIFFGVIFCFAVIGYVLNRFIKIVLLGGINRLTGAIFGLLQGVVVLSVIMLALNSSAAPQSLRNQVSKSQLAPPFTEFGDSIFRGSRDLIGR